MADSMGSNGNSLMVTLLRCATNNDNTFGSRLSDDYRFRLSWWIVLADFQRLMGQEGRPEILATTGGTGTSDVRPPIKSCFTVETCPCRFTQHWWAAACYATVSTPHPWKISSDSSTWIAPQNGPNRSLQNFTTPLGPTGPMGPMGPSIDVQKDHSGGIFGRSWQRLHLGFHHLQWLTSDSCWLMVMQCQHCQKFASSSVDTRNSTLQLHALLDSMNEREQDSSWPKYFGHKNPTNQPKNHHKGPWQTSQAKQVKKESDLRCSNDAGFWQVSIECSHGVHL